MSMMVPVAAQAKDGATSATPAPKKADTTESPDKSVGAVPVPGRAFAEGPRLSKNARRKRNRKARQAVENAAEKPFAPNSEERTAYAQRWGIAETDERFTAALSSRASVEFFEGLKPAQRSVVEPDEILGAVQLQPVEWDKRRRARHDLLTDEDKSFMAAHWGLARDHENVIWALENPANWEYAIMLSAEQMPYLSRRHKKNRDKPPSPEEIENIKKIRAEVAAKAQAEAERKAKEEAAAKKKAEDAEKRTEGEAQWVTYRDQVLADIKARIEAEVPGMAEETIKNLVSTTDERIAKNKQINIGRQIRTLKDEIDATFELEKKTRAVNNAAKAYSNLKGNIVRDLEQKVLKDTALTVVDFVAEAEEARDTQRNLADIDEKERPAAWARLLGLTLYRSGVTPPSRKLTDRAGLPVHYTVDTDSFKVKPPTGVTMATTPDELLDGLFMVPDYWLRIHVTLETGYSPRPDDLQQPKRRWKEAGAAADYSLELDGRWRWTQRTLDEAIVKKALDEAYDELRDLLRARAKEVLDRDCRT